MIFRIVFWSGSVWMIQLCVAQTKDSGGWVTCVTNKAHYVVSSSYFPRILSLSPSNHALRSQLAAIFLNLLSVSFLHDRLLHLDEVEIDMNSIVLRVTPSRLSRIAQRVQQDHGAGTTCDARNGKEGTRRR
jgi:hypothetical protein